jgi:hypothetical protein
MGRGNAPGGCEDDDVDSAPVVGWLSWCCVEGSFWLSWPPAGCSSFPPVKNREMFWKTLLMTPPTPCSPSGLGIDGSGIWVCVCSSWACGLGLFLSDSGTSEKRLNDTVIQELGYRHWKVNSRYRLLTTPDMYRFPLTTVPGIQYGICVWQDKDIKYERWANLLTSIPRLTCRESE